MATRQELLTEAHRRGLLPPDMAATFEEATRRGLLGGEPAAPAEPIQAPQTPLQEPPAQVQAPQPTPPKHWMDNIPRLNKHARIQDSVRSGAQAEHELGQGLEGPDGITAEAPFPDPTRTLPPESGGLFNQLPRPRRHEAERAELQPTMTTSSEQISKEHAMGGVEEPWIQPEIVGAAAFGAGTKIAIAAGKKLLPSLMQGLATMIPAAGMEFPIGQAADLAAQSENPELALLISVSLGVSSGMTVEHLAEKGILKAVRGAIRRYPKVAKATLPKELMTQFKGTVEPAQTAPDSIDKALGDLTPEKAVKPDQILQPPKPTITIKGQGPELPGPTGFQNRQPEEFIAARDKSSRPQFLSPYDKNEMVKRGFKIKLNGEGDVGYALTEENDLVNVFNNSTRKGAGKDAVFDAVAQGAETLDAFDTGYLPKYYKKFGFIEVKRDPWDDQYAPPNWDYAKYDKPDIVYMKYEGGDRGSLRTRYPITKPDQTPAGDTGRGSLPGGGHPGTYPGEGRGLREAEPHGPARGLGSRPASGDLTKIPTPPKPEKLEAILGAPAGLEQDEEGNLTLDPRKAIIGMFAAAAGGKAAGKSKWLGRRLQDSWDKKFGEPIVDYFRRTWDGWIVNEDLRYALGKDRSKEASRLIADTQRQIEVAQAAGIRIAKEIEELAPTQLEQRRFRQIIKGSVSASKQMTAKAQKVNELFTKLKDLEKQHDLYKYSRFDKATDKIGPMNRKERARIRKLLSGSDPYTQTAGELSARAKELGMDPDQLLQDSYRGRGDIEKKHGVKVRSDKDHDKNVLAKAVADHLAFEKSRLNDYYHFGSAEEYFPLYYSKHEGLSPKQRKDMQKVIKDLKKQSRRGTPEGKQELESQISEYEDMLGRGLKGRGARRVKKMELSQGYSHRRVDMPIEVQRLLGRIDEATFPVAKGATQQGSDIAKAKLFEAIADNPEWSFRYAKGMEKPANYKLVDGKQFGAMDGMYVRRDILDQLQEVEDMRSSLGRGYDHLHGIWKSWHTVWNPATQFRNNYWNACAAWLADVPFSEFSKAAAGKGVYWEAAEALRLGEPNMYYKEARDWGLLNNTFYAHELNAMRDELERLRDPNKLKNWIRDAMSVPGKAYQGSEKYFKMAVFIKARKDGLSIDEGARKAEEYLFDYSDIPPWVKHTKRFGIPFLTFSYKIWPLMAKLAIKKPVKIAALLSSPWVINELSKRNLGFSDEEAQKERDLLPPWMQQKTLGVGPYLHPLAPFKDRWGNNLYWDMSNLLPYASVGDEAGQSGIPLSEFVPVGNPFASILFGIVHNRDKFTGKDIYNKTMYESERKIEELASRALQDKIEKQLSFAWANLGPPMAPGGYNWSKLQTGLLNTLNKEAQVLDWAERPYELPDAVLGAILGIKLSPANQEKMREFETYKIRPILRELGSARRKLIRECKNNEITKKERDEGIEWLNLKQKLILKDKSEKLK